MVGKIDNVIVVGELDAEGARVVEAGLVTLGLLARGLVPGQVAFVVTHLLAHSRPVTPTLRRLLHREQDGLHA